MNEFVEALCAAIDRKRRMIMRDEFTEFLESLRSEPPADVPKDDPQPPVTPKLRARMQDGAVYVRACDVAAALERCAPRINAGIIAALRKVAEKDERP